MRGHEGVGGMMGQCIATGRKRGRNWEKYKSYEMVEFMRKKQTEQEILCSMAKQCQQVVGTIKRGSGVGGGEGGENRHFTVPSIIPTRAIPLPHSLFFNRHSLILFNQTIYFFKT